MMQQEHFKPNYRNVNCLIDLILADVCLFHDFLFIGDILNIDLELC